MSFTTSSTNLQSSQHPEMLHFYSDISEVSKTTQAKIEELSERIASYSNIFSLYSACTEYFSKINVTYNTFLLLAGYILRFLAFLIDLILIPLQWILYYFFSRPIIHQLEEEKANLEDEKAQLQEDLEVSWCASEITQDPSSSNDSPCKKTAQQTLPFIPPTTDLLASPAISPRSSYLEPASPPTQIIEGKNSLPPINIDSHLFTTNLFQWMLEKHKKFRSTIAQECEKKRNLLLKIHILQMANELIHNYCNNLNVDKNFLLIHLLVFLNKYYLSNNPKCTNISTASLFTKSTDLDEQMLKKFTPFLWVSRIQSNLKLYFDLIVNYLSNPNNDKFWKENQSVFEQTQGKTANPNAIPELVNSIYHLSQYLDYKISIPRYSIDPLDTGKFFTFYVHILHSNGQGSPFLSRFSFEFKWRVLYPSRKVEVQPPQLMLPRVDFESFKEI